MEIQTTLRSFPESMNCIMGSVIKKWTTTNPEAVREIHKWHIENDEFLFKSKDEQREYISNNNIKSSEENRQDFIDKQLSLLKSKGMLSDKRPKMSNKDHLNQFKQTSLDTSS